MSSRKKVEIPDRALLDTLKFLMGPQWQKMRFVSRQLAEVVRDNISELPHFIIDNVKFSETYMRSKSAEIVASDIAITSNEKREWFMMRGINSDAPEDLQNQNAVIGMGAKYGKKTKPSIFYYADVDGLAETSKTISGQGYQHRKPVLFSAAFNADLNEYSWASMEYFLNLLYNPLTYIKTIEMYALSKNLTDAFFLGDDYGNYIYAGTFTLIGDLCKSLPWIHKNVRADTIYFPGDFTDVENSYKEASNFLLDTAWTCADQTRNVKTVKIKLERVYYWKWFIKFLTKKFRTLSTIHHAAPSIEFSFYKSHGETLNLNYLVWDPDVIKLKPEESLHAEAVYEVSNGRNRMEIAIIKRSDFVNVFSRRSMSYVRKTKSKYDVSVNMYSIQSALPSGEKVYVSNDTWLEALKFLSFPNWSKALFVSRQVARVVQGNISHLPCIVIDNATMSEAAFITSDGITSFDDNIPANWQNKFFTEHEFSLNAPANVQYKNAFIELSSKNWYSNYHSIVMSLRGTTQDMQQSRKSIIFCAELNKHKEYSWAALSYFLKFLYHPAVCTKEVSIFAPNQKIVDDLFDAEERFIRCGAFTLGGAPESPPNMDKFCKSLLWLERNVRANTIHFPEHIDYKNENIYELIPNFLMDASWKCARQEVNFKCICNMDSFVKALVQKFQTVCRVRKDIPMFSASVFGHDETMDFLLLDPDVLKLKSQESEGDVYIISNGENRMQIEIFKGRKNGVHGCRDINYQYHDHGFHLFLVYVKVYTI